jgi:uncharacterized protein (TIGR03435 family)
MVVSEATSASITGDVRAASIFDALKDQLGLELKPSTGPVDVLVIDHVERPTPD